MRFVSAEGVLLHLGLSPITSQRDSAHSTVPSGGFYGNAIKIANIEFVLHFNTRKEMGNSASPASTGTSRWVGVVSSNNFYRNIFTLPNSFYKVSE